MESSEHPVARRTFAAGSYARTLLTSVGSGAAAAVPFAISDIVRASASAKIWIGASSALAVVGLWVWLGALLGLGLWLTRLIVVRIKRYLPNRLAWQSVVASVAGTFALLLARKMFAGAGVQRTFVGTWGARVLPLAVTLAAWLALWLAARFAPGGWRSTWPRVNTALVASLAIGAAVLDARTADGYLFLHVLLLAFGLVLATEALELIRLPRRAKYFASALALVSLPFLVTFPASLRARELLGQPTWAGLELVSYAQVALDFDHDGHSAWFGGGDCNDRDASVFPGALEKPDDGRDSDCDGFDDPKPPSLIFAPFQITSLLPGRKLSERAKQYPTVVVLIDALRFDRAGDSRFPNLAQLSRESIRFTHMYATASTTLASVPAMMTGRVGPGGFRENIAQSLAHANQSSAFVAPDVIIEHFEPLAKLDPVRSFTAREPIPTDFRTAWLGKETVTTGNQITARAVALLDAPAPPDLVWLHYFDVHQWDTLDLPEGHPQGASARYDAALKQMDASLAPLLERRNRLNIVVLADHGEGLGAHGVERHTSFLFEELSHVPFLIRIPATEPVAVDVPIAGTAVYNTLRALRGLPPDAGADGNALDLVGASNVGDGPGFAGLEQQQWSLVFGNHRLLYMPRQQLVQLYDVAGDPHELKNLAELEPKLASQMLARLFQLERESRR